MSSLGYAVAAAQIGATTMMIRPQRGIKQISLADGTRLPDIIAQATLEERHLDRMEITDHPVEQGASITDHAFKVPAELVLRLGWSNSPSSPSSLADASLGFATALGGSAGIAVGSAVGIASAAQSLFTGAAVDQVTAIYNNLLLLQYGRALFTIYTGKRVYYNMMCRMLATETDAMTAQSLPIIMECQEVILVNTRTVSLPSSTQANPSVTASPVNKGTQQLIPSTP